MGKAAGDWSKREWSDTIIQTTGRIRRGTAPGKGAACSPQGLPEMLNTVRWGQKLLRHYSDTSIENEKEIIRKFENMDKKYKKEKPREKIGKMVRYMKKKTERRKGETEWNTKIGTSKMKVATMNPDNIVDEGIIDEIIDKMEKHNIDIAAIQETHDKRENDRSYRGHRIIKSAAKEVKDKDGKQKLAEAGVAIIMKEEFAEEITKVIKYNERHIEVTIKNNIIISNTYAPHKGYSKEIQKEYWEGIEKNLYKTEDNKKMHIWMTDNNGQLGTKSKKCKNIGKHVRTKICNKGNGANLKKNATK